jgi:hypothetical protein
MQNNKLKNEYKENIKRAFSVMEDNEILIKFLNVIYQSCNFATSIDINSLIFMEGRRSLYQNLFLPFMSKKLKAKVEVFYENCN